MSDTAVMALIALVGSAISLLLRTSGRRDELKYDVKFAVMEDRQKRCESDSIAKDIRIANLEAQIVTLTATDVKDRVELEAKIMTAVHEAKDATNAAVLKMELSDAKSKS